MVAKILLYPGWISHNTGVPFRTLIERGSRVRMLISTRKILIINTDGKHTRHKDKHSNYNFYYFRKNITSNRILMTSTSCGLAHSITQINVS